MTASLAVTSQSPSASAARRCACPAYAEAARQKTIWTAELLRLEYEQRSDALIEVEVARTVAGDLWREQRDARLAWSAKVAPFIAGELGVDADRLATLLGQYVYRQLQELGEAQPDFTDGCPSLLRRRSRLTQHDGPPASLFSDNKRHIFRIWWIKSEWFAG